MESRLIRIIFSFILISVMITSVGGQDYYYDEITYRYSAELKEGVELTWIFLQYSIIIPEFNDTDQTTYTYYDEYTTTNVNGEEVVETVETVYVEENSYYGEFPDIPENTLYKMKLLKDLANKTEDYLYPNFEEVNNEYFDISISKGIKQDIVEFLPPGFFMRPSIIVFENGTETNAFEYEYEQQKEYLEEQTDNNYPEEDYSYEIFIENGEYVEKDYYTNGNETNSFETRMDIDKGVLLYLYALAEGNDFHLEIEIKLHETLGVNINNFGPNEELSLPLSPYFVYALLVFPILVRKSRKN